VQANLEKEVEREKALAEAEGRIKENRENEDVNRRAMQLRLEEERKKLVEAINTTFTNLGSGTLALLTDKEKLGTALAGLTVLALGVYSAREGTRVAGQVFSRYHVLCCCCYVEPMMQVSFTQCTMHCTLLSYAPFCMVRAQLHCATADCGYTVVAFCLHGLSAKLVQQDLLCNLLTVGREGAHQQTLFSKDAKSTV